MCIRDHHSDLRKSGRELSEQFDANLTCTVPGCESPLTMFRGPNDKKLCREHQIMQREYGGLARIDRLYTFHKKWICDCCGYDPRIDSYFESPPIPWENEEHKLRAMRAMLVVDHIIRQADGGLDSKENTQTFCQNCNTKKSINSKDYIRANVE